MSSLLSNVGIVGLGKMGILHAGILSALPNCKVVAVCEKETLLRRAAKKLLPKISFYDNVREMVNRHDLQAIYITTPIASHLAIVSDLVDAKKSLGIFIEKPLAGNYEDAKEIVNKTTLLGNLGMIGFQKRFSPQFQRTKQLLDSNALGDLLFFKGYSYVSGVFSRGNGWRFQRGQGGCLLDLGSHLIDLILWYFGEPSWLSATERSFYSEQVEDYSHASFGYGNGLTGHIDVSWSVEGYRLPESLLEIYGKNGTIRINDDSLRMRIYGDVPNVISSGNYYLNKPDLSKGVDFLLGDPEYCLEDKYFLQCLSIGKTPNLGLNEGLKVNKIAEAIHKAAQTTKMMPV